MAHNQTPNGLPIIGGPPPAARRTVLVMPDGRELDVRGSLNIPPGLLEGVPEGASIAGDVGLTTAIAGFWLMLDALRAELVALSDRLERAGVLPPVE
jgi:hypothetical protein